MRRSLVTCLALGLAWPVPAAAGQRRAAPEVEDREARARELYEEGKVKFETADYLGAIEDWTEAYSSLPATKAHAKTKVLLLYNLASARESAYEVDKDIQQLRQAKILLENFETQIPAIYGEGLEADRERERVQERLQILDEKLAEAEAEARADGDGKDGAQDPVLLPRPDPEPEPPADQPYRGLLIGGAVAAGVGVAGMGLLAGGLVMGQRANDISDLDPNDIVGRRNQFDRGRLGNTLAIVGGVVGGAALATGAVLLAIGARRKSAATARLDAAPGGLAVRF